MQRLIFVLGESDCEGLGQGLLIQPVNALSSLTFSVLGFIVLVSATKRQDRERKNRMLFGLLMMATGIGSFMFHGPQGPASQFLHDITFVLVVLSVALMNLSAVVDWSERRTFSAMSVVGLTTSAILIVWPSSTNIIAGVAVLALIGVDVALHRSIIARTRWWTFSIVMMALAIMFFILGRTGGPICDSESIFQGHALWHLLSGVALWTYFGATTAARSRDAR